MFDFDSLVNLVNIQNSITVIMAVVAITSLVIAWDTRRKNNYKSLCYDIKEQGLFDSQRVKDSRLKIIYEDGNKKYVGSNLTKSYLLIYNNCSSLVSDTDLLVHPKIKVPQDAQIYDFELISEDDEANQVRVDQSEDSLNIHIGRLDEKTGFIVRIEHSALEGQLAIECDSRDDGKIKKINRLKYLITKGVPELIILILMIVLLYSSYSGIEANFLLVVLNTFVGVYLILFLVSKSEKIRNNYARRLIRSKSIQTFYYRKIIEFDEKRGFN